MFSRLTHDVWFACAVASLRTILVTEEFWRLPKALTYPLIPYERNQKDEALVSIFSTEIWFCHPIIVQSHGSSKNSGLNHCPLFAME
jgi:hypothetical protein